MVKVGMTAPQRTDIQAAGKGAGPTRFQACEAARHDGLTQLDTQCSGGSVTWLRNQPLSFAPGTGCSVMVYGACTVRASAERCR
jgi:hypothetical protein